MKTNNKAYRPYHSKRKKDKKQDMSLSGCLTIFSIFFIFILPIPLWDYFKDRKETNIAIGMQELNNFPMLYTNLPEKDRLKLAIRHAGKHKYYFAPSEYKPIVIPLTLSAHRAMYYEAFKHYYDYFIYYHIDYTHHYEEKIYLNYLNKLRSDLIKIEYEQYLKEKRLNDLIEIFNPNSNKTISSKKVNTPEETIKHQENQIIYENSN
jgi:hypothetical protein